MDYGKKNAKKRETELTSKKTVMKKKATVTFSKALLVLFFSVIILGGSAAFGIWKGIIDSAPSIDELDATPTGFQTIVLDNEGNKTATLVASGSNRKYVTIDEIPLNLQHAFVAIEDERFYEHNGIDLQGILRAGIHGITSGNFDQGASTITQQLLKNTVFADIWAGESSFIDKVERKIQEQYLAVQLEKKVNDKDWILENYLNAINLGQNTLGVAVASERYFGKPVSDLTLSECAVLAAITQNPSRFNPISNPTKNAERRLKVLNDMKTQGYITQSEYDKALADDVYERIQVVNIETGETSINSYFVDELTDQVIQDLIEQKGYTETQAYKALYQGGLTIYSTQDSYIQEICDEEANNLDNYPSAPKVSFSYRLTIEKADGTIKNYSEQTMLSYYRKKNSNYNINFASEEDAAAAIEQYKADIMEAGDTIVGGGESVVYTLQPQVALTVIDQSTGEVKAVVGGRGDKTASKTLNRATDTTRQPGSTFKIISAFAPALDAGGLTLADVQDDAPFHYTDSVGKSVSNADGRFRGFTTLREAIISSINVVTVKTYMQINPRLGHSYALDFGFTTILPEEADNQSLCLGGLTNGVTNLELTAAYAAIANQGTYQKPRFYTKILDHDGNVLLDNSVSETHTVLKESTAWLLTDAMRDVMTSGTGKTAYFGSSMPQAGKTGTTTKSRDAVFAGYTPYYTCAVWGGFDDNMKQTSGQTSYPRKIWKAVMSRIHEELPAKEFEKPSGIVRASVCKESGKLPIAGVCEADPRGSAVISEYFAEGTVPTTYCDHHTRASVCTASGMLAGSYCPPETVSSNVYIIGGSTNSEDAGHLLNATETCTLHTFVEPTYNGEVSFPTIPGVDSFDTTTDPSVTPDNTVTDPPADPNNTVTNPPVDPATVPGDSVTN